MLAPTAVAYPAGHGPSYVPRCRVCLATAHYGTQACQRALDVDAAPRQLLVLLDWSVVGSQTATRVLQAVYQHVGARGSVYQDELGVLVGKHEQVRATSIRDPQLPAALDRTARRMPNEHALMIGPPAARVAQNLGELLAARDQTRRRLVLLVIAGDVRGRCYNTEALRVLMDENRASLAILHVTANGRADFAADLESLAWMFFQQRADKEVAEVIQELVDVFLLRRYH